MRKIDYSRREFFKHGSLSGLGVLALGRNLVYEAGKDAPDNGKPENIKIDKIAGLSLEQLRDKYRSELFENFIPNMDKYAIDHDYGGVMCSLDVRSGQLENKNKTAWFVGRGMWVYSFLYNNMEQNTRYLEIARKSKDLLLKLQPTDKSFWTAKFTCEGDPLSGPGDIYGSLFVAEGLSEYSKASGEKEYRELAKKIIFDCVDRYDQPDYSYTYTYLRGAPQIQGIRVLGHWMILLSLSTQMLSHEPDDDLEKLAARSVDAIMNHHINKDYGLTNEFINHDFSLPDNEFAQFSVIGHGLETLAFVMFEAARIRDASLFHSAETGFKKHVDVGADALYGGNFDILENADNYTWRLNKSLWCQQEVLNGTLFLIEHTGDEWGQRNFSRADKYIYDKFYNKNNKFWYSGGDRKMSNPNVSLMEHYHHARQLMKGIQAIERIIKRGGRPSGLFC